MKIQNKLKTEYGSTKFLIVADGEDTEHTQTKAELFEAEDVAGKNCLICL